MNGFVKSSTVIAILLLSATVAFADGTLRPAPSGGNGIHPDPLHGKDNALGHVVENGNQTAYDAVDKDKLRVLRPAPAPVK